MDPNPLQMAFGLILIFFLPGYLLVKALFPGRNELDKEYNLIYEIGLGMGLSIVIAILDGFLLGSLHQLIGFRIVDGREVGYFDTPYIVASLLLICLLLFIAAWYRGAFPWMRKLHPSLARVPASEKPQARKQRMDALIIKIWDLSRQREDLRRQLRDSERKSRAHGPDMRSHYKKKAEEARAALAKVDGEIKELEDRRAEELAGVEEDETRRKEEKARRRQGRAILGKSEGPADAPAPGPLSPPKQIEPQPADSRDGSPKEPEGGSPEAKTGPGRSE
jgi:hypothetical protein